MIMEVAVVSGGLVHGQLPRRLALQVDPKLFEKGWRICTRILLSIMRHVSCTWLRRLVVGCIGRVDM